MTSSQNNDNADLEVLAGNVARALLRTDELAQQLRALDERLGDAVEEIERELHALSDRVHTVATARA